MRSFMCFISSTPSCLRPAKSEGVVVAPNRTRIHGVDLATMVRE